MLLTTFPMKIWRQLPANAMVIFSSNSASKLAIHLQSRALIIPWAGMKAGCIKCSNERDYSSSFPVRYIPRKSLESGESEGNSPARFPEPSYSSNEQLNRDVRRVEFSRNRHIPDNTQTYRVESKPQNESMNFGVGFGVGKDINREEQFEDDGVLEEPEEFMHEGKVSEVKEPNDEYCGFQGSSGIRQDVENLAVEILAKRYIPRKKLESGESEGISPARFSEPSYSSNEQLNRDVRRVEFSRHRHITDNTQTYRIESKSQNKSMNFGVGSGVGKDINCEDQFEDDSVSEEPEEFMHEGKVSEVKEPNDEYSGFQGSSGIRQDVENMAVEILAKRAFTAAELRKKLLGKQFPRVIVDSVILDYQKRGLVNDSLYAETYSRSRWSTSTWGPRRIKKALLDKGVNNEDVEKAVKLVLNDTKSAEDEESELGMSQHAMNHLFVQASKQWKRSVNMPRETRKSRIVRWLQYRGFSWNIISVVLKKLESDHQL